jgi:hypothetical protein
MPVNSNYGNFYQQVANGGQGQQYGTGASLSRVQQMLSQRQGYDGSNGVGVPAVYRMPNPYQQSQQQPVQQQGSPDWESQLGVGTDHMGRMNINMGGQSPVPLLQPGQNPPPVDLMGMMGVRTGHMGRRIVNMGGQMPVQQQATQQQATQQQPVQQSQSNDDQIQSLIKQANATQALREQIQAINDAPMSEGAPVSEWTGSSYNAPYIDNALRAPMSQGRNPGGNIAANQFLQGGYQDSLRQRVQPDVNESVDAAIARGNQMNSLDAGQALGNQSGRNSALMQLAMQQQAAAMQNPSTAGQTVPIPVMTPGGQRVEIDPQTAAPGVYNVDSSGAQTNANRGFGSGTQGNLQVSVGPNGRAQLLPREGWQRPENQDEVTRNMRAELAARQDRIQQNRTAQYNTPAGRQARADIARQQKELQAQQEGYGSVAAQIIAEQERADGIRSQLQRHEMGMVGKLPEQVASQQAADAAAAAAEQQNDLAIQGSRNEGAIGVADAQGQSAATVAGIDAEGNLDVAALDSGNEDVMKQRGLISQDALDSKFKMERYSIPAGMDQSEVATYATNTLLDQMARQPMDQFNAKFYDQIIDANQLRKEDVREMINSNLNSGKDKSPMERRIMAEGLLYYMEHGKVKTKDQITQGIANILQPHQSTQMGAFSAIPGAHYQPQNR